MMPVEPGGRKRTMQDQVGQDQVGDRQDGVLLAELLCARLCHDLAGPVAAVGTGAELLADEDGGGAGLEAEALALLATSAAVAGHRLRFLRLVLGSSNAAVAAPALRELAANFLAGAAPAGQSLTLSWRDGGTAAWAAGAAKMLLNLVLLARDCLPRGGVVRVEARSGEGPLARVSAEGPGAQPGEAAAEWAAAASPLASLGPRGAQGRYARLLAERLGLAPTLESAADRVVFGISRLV